MNQIKSLILISFIAIFSNIGAQTWNQLGGTVFTGSSSSELDMQVSPSGQVYVAGKNSSVNDDHYVYNYVNGSGWQQVGSSIPNNGGGTRMAPFSLYIDPSNSNMYLAYVDYSSLQIYVSMFSGGIWSNIGGPVYTISGADPIYEIELTSNGSGGLALAFIEAQGGNYNVHHYEYNGASWGFVTDVISSLNLENDLDLELAPTTNNLVVSFVLNTGGGNGDVRVYQYSGGSWSPLATGNWNGSHAAMDVDTTNGDIYISYIQMNPPQYVYVNKYSSTTFIWSTVGGSGGQVSTQNASGVDLMVMNNNPVVSFVDQSDLQSYVYEYSTVWNLISPTPSSGGLENTTNNHSTPVLAYDSYGSYYVSSNDLTAPGTASVYRKCTAPVISVSTQDVTCNGGSNGAISISGSGGVSPYQFSIDGGINLNTTGTFSNLTAGSYISYVEDANGCSATQTVVINEPAAVSVGLMSYSNASCNGVCDGSLSLGASGVSPYTFSIDGSNYQTSNSFSNMCAGSYTYYAQDANGCVGSSTINISEPAVLTIGFSSANMSCHGICDGSATASGSGGTSSYTYSWSTGATTASINNLCAGTYTCTITDANGCTTSNSVTITEPAAQSLSVASLNNATCKGACDGSASINASGSFSWSNGSTVPGISNVCAGYYLCTVTDGMGCSDTISVTITEPATALVPSQTVTNVSCNGGNDGSVTLGGSGGVPPYTYSFNNSILTSTATYTGLSVGTYNAYIQDANSCMIPFTTTITEPAAISATMSGGGTICAGDAIPDISITFSGTAPWTIVYNDGTSNISINPAASPYVLSNAADGTYTLVSMSDATCSGSVSGSATITTNPSDDASFSYSASSFCAPGMNPIPTITGTAGGTFSSTSGLTINSSTGEIDLSLSTSGTYTVTYTTSGTCPSSSNVSVTINPITPFNVNVGSNPTTCGGADGYFILTALDPSTTYNVTYTDPLGGTQGPTSMTSNAAGDIQITGLSAGNYSNFIVERNGCSYSDASTYTLTEPSFGLDETNVSVTNASCANNDGSITGILLVGGSAPFSYTYNNISTTGIDFIGGPGTYTLTVTDANACVATSSSYTIGATTSTVSVSLTPTNVTCNGQCNGSVSSSVSGGTAPYTYVWGNGNTSPSPTGICAGNYTVTVTDANQCTGSAATTVTQPNPMTITVSTTLPTCGANDGSATVTGVTGGSAPYSYLWSNGSFIATADSLASGVYTVTVTDNNGCTAIKTVNLSSSSAPSITSTLNSPTCHGGADGSINLTISGGTAPYTYDWSTGEHTNNISNLAGGTYDVTISDASGCSVSETFTLLDATAIDLTNYTVSDASCGGNDGSIAVTVSGGAGGYTYLWSSGGTTSTESNLAPGTYNLSVSDVNGCLSQKSYTVSNAGGPVITVDQVNEPTCQSGTGDILVTVTGGTAPYTYSWSNGATSEDLYNVSAGNYELTVTDNVGCQGVEYAELVGVNTSTTPICMVTVDLNTGTNVVVWPKVFGQGIAYYEVFKETSVINNFQSIATVPFDSISQFVDTAANPQIHSYRYNLRTIDSCGNYSEFLTIHKTIHLSTNIGLNNVINLAWDDYVGFPYNTFYIDRYHSTTGWVTIDSVPANVHSFTDNNYPGLNSLEYSIEVKPANPCIAQKQQSHNTTRSNRAILAGGSSGTGIEETILNQVEVYPNPFNDQLTINVGVNNWYYSMIDITGKVIFSNNSNQSQQKINLSSLDNGIYFVKISIGEHTIIKKVIKTK